jgi:uncharacterized protein YbbC (DUF1343 family)
MIEWSAYTDTERDVQVFSLYSDTRRPTEEMLSRFDVLVVDLQDVGARYYTFVQTLALAMDSCREFNREIIVLDRPNPIGGSEVEGPVLEPEFKSFVGLHPVAVRHGMTVGELAEFFNTYCDIGSNLTVVRMEGWTRDMHFIDTDLPWVLPSPNMPLLETAFVYPGLCLLEGTNVSEGRGTTRPFEFSGAPWIHPDTLVSELRHFDLPGAIFRPAYFSPTFHKWAGHRVGGVQIHVVDRESFRPFRTGVALVMLYRRLGGADFDWKQPPYEYEMELLPFDILCGTDRVRLGIEAEKNLEEIEGSWVQDLRAFENIRKRYLLY